HQQAARAVLRALLPEAGADIKGHMRSYDELLVGSGYSGRTADFDDLVRLLDAELRLITPTDPAQGERRGVSPPSCYQLTHDYLVPALREWLTRKQKETRRGRAELRLAERAAGWQNQPTRQQLPLFWEWLGIRWHTRSRHWTGTERALMRRADRYYVARAGLLAVWFAALALG